MSEHTAENGAGHAFRIALGCKANKNHHSLLHSDRRVITCTGCVKRWDL